MTSGSSPYPLLPPPFEPPEWDNRTPFGRDVQSQQATVEEDADGVDTWVASVLIARLLAGDGFYGPEQGAPGGGRVRHRPVLRQRGRRPTDRRNEATDRRRPPGVADRVPPDPVSLPDITTTGETMIIVVVETVAGSRPVLRLDPRHLSAVHGARARGAVHPPGGGLNRRELRSG